MKIYIAGKISGLDRKEAEANFSRAEEVLTKMGHKPVSPYGKGSYRWSWEENMRVALRLLLGCQGIYMLSNYTDSMGAMVELDLAKKLNMIIMYEIDGEVTV